MCTKRINRNETKSYTGQYNEKKTTKSDNKNCPVNFICQSKTV